MKSSDFNVFSINIRCIYGSETIIKVLPTCFTPLEILNGTKILKEI